MAPKSKPASANGAAKKPKADTSSGTATPTVSTAETHEFVVYGSGKPEKALYDAEQNKIKAEIDALQAKLVCPRVYMPHFQKFHTSISSGNRMRSRTSFL